MTTNEVVQGFDTEHNLADRASGIFTVEELSHKVEQVRRSYAKRLLSALVDELMMTDAACLAGLTCEMKHRVVEYTEYRHAKARTESILVANSDPELVALGQLGRWPTMAVFYKHTANGLRDMAETAGEGDSPLLHIMADMRSAVGYAFACDEAAAKSAAESARMRGMALVGKKLLTA